MDYKENIKNCLRTHLMGDENLDKRNRIISELNVKLSTIKGWLVPSATWIPNAELFPGICRILNISLYELFGIDDPSLLSNEEVDLIKKYRESTNKEAIDLILKIK